jgi:hypothetical protein
MRRVLIGSILASHLACAPPSPPEADPEDPDAPAELGAPSVSELDGRPLVLEPPRPDPRFWLRSRPVLRVAPARAALAFAPDGHSALEVREERRILWDLERGSPISVFLDEEEPVWVGPREVVTRREARLFSREGKLRSILGGRDAVDVRVAPEPCGVIALRLGGGPEYSLRTFSRTTGEAVADFPWIPARLEPDFDYEPACNGRRVLVFSKEHPHLPRSEPKTRDQLLFLAAESELLGRWSAPRGESVLAARFDPSGTSAWVLSRRGSRLQTSHVYPSGRRTPLRNLPESAESRRDLEGAPSAIEPTWELDVQAIGASAVPIRVVEQAGQDTLVVRAQDGRSASLSAKGAATELPFVELPAFDGPDGSWVVAHPRTGLELSVWLLDMDPSAESPDPLLVLVTSPSGAFYGATELQSYVFYPDGHQLIEPKEAGDVRCTHLFRPGILSAFFGHAGSVPSSKEVDPEQTPLDCSPGPGVGKMLGDD